MSTIGKFGAVFIVLVVAAMAAGASFSDATHVFTVEGESITVDYDDPVAVDSADVAVSFYDNETVYNASGDPLVEGTDYEWNTDNGSVTWFDTAATTDAETGSIDYAYDAPSERSRDLASVLSIGGYGLALALLLFGGVVVLGWLGLIPGGGR